MRSESLEMLQPLWDFMRSEKEANFHEYRSSFARMVEYFCAWDAHNYEKWAAQYLLDLMEIEEKWPDKTRRPPSTGSAWSSPCSPS